jgi:hypothetical protein
MICLQRPALGLAAMVAILTTGFADSAAAKHPLPFQGQFRALESTETLLPPEVPVPTLIVDASGSGRATLVGRFTLDYEFEVNLENFVGVGSAQFRSGRRDSLTTHVDGQGTVPTEDGVSFVFETHTVAGGTGRFAGATGGFVVVRVLNVFTGETFGVFDGTIRVSSVK